MAWTNCMVAPGCRCPPVPRPSRRAQYLPAGRRQVVQRNLGPRGWRRGRRWRRLGMQHRVGEPPVEILAATVAGGYRLLRLAVRAVRRAVDADMEMIIVLPILPHLVEPGAIVAGLAA